MGTAVLHAQFSVTKNSSSAKVGLSFDLYTEGSGCICSNTCPTWPAVIIAYPWVPQRAMRPSRQETRDLDKTNS